MVLTDPGPAVKSELFSQYVAHSDNMPMFIASVAMLSAQSHSVNSMVDSGAGMSGTSSTNNLRDTMSYRIPSFVNVRSLMTPSAAAFNTDPNAGVIGMRHDIVSRKLLVLLVPDMPAPESTIQLTE